MPFSKSTIVLFLTALAFAGTANAQPRFSPPSCPRPSIAQDIPGAPSALLKRANEILSDVVHVNNEQAAIAAALPYYRSAYAATGISHSESIALTSLYLSAALNRVEGPGREGALLESLALMDELVCWHGKLEETSAPIRGSKSDEASKMQGALLELWAPISNFRNATLMALGRTEEALAGLKLRVNTLVPEISRNPARLDPRLRTSNLNVYALSGALRAIAAMELERGEIKAALEAVERSSAIGLHVARDRHIGRSIATDALLEAATPEGGMVAIPFRYPRSGLDLGPLDRVELAMIVASKVGNEVRLEAVTSTGAVWRAIDSAIIGGELDIATMGSMWTRDPTAPTRLNQGWLRWHMDQTSGIGDWPKLKTSVESTYWTAFGEPLRDIARRRGLAPDAPLIWMPSQYLGLVPLAVARDPVTGESPIDRFTITVSPSLTLAADPRRPSSRSLASIANPSGDLAYAAIEGRTARLIVDAKRPPTADLNGADIWHFATHGEFDWTNAGASRLQTGATTYLTMGEIGARRDRTPPSLVVLSACSAGVADPTRFDSEWTGFPGAFLKLGAREVVAPLWPVDDLATTLLMTRFFEAIRRGEPTAQALRSSQVWVRNADRADLQDSIERLLSNGLMARADADVLLAAIERLGADAPFADPYFWAAFQLYRA